MENTACKSKTQDQPKRVVSEREDGREVVSATRKDQRE